MIVEKTIWQKLPSKYSPRLFMLYQISENEMTRLQRTTFEKAGLSEREMQDMLKKDINVIAEDLLVVAEEFCDWEDSNRRIDLLGIDKNANLIVIEIKRTSDGGHAELQAVRYAAMISTLTFDKLVRNYEYYLNKNGVQEDASEKLLEFLGWNEPNDDQFAQDVKIILVAAEFSKEVMTSVIWLNDSGLDIRCARMRPYINDGKILLDVETIIPLPETADYQIRIRDKKQRERAARDNARDLTKFDLRIDGEPFERLSKRWMVFHIIHTALKQGITPEKIMDAMPEKGKKRLFMSFDGTLNADQFREQCVSNHSEDRAKRYFMKDDELFHSKGKTYAISNQWGARTLEAVKGLSEAFPELDIQYSSAPIE